MSLRICAYIAAAAALALAAPAAMAAPASCENQIAPDDPLPGQMGNISVFVCNYTDTVAAITEVNVIGPGGGLFAFADPLAGPSPGETGLALASALAWFGLPPDTPAELSLAGPFTTETFTSDWKPLLSPSVTVLGDPEDYSTWIMLTGNANIFVSHTRTVLDAYRLEARIGDATAIPLPASALLLLGGLAAIGGLRRRKQVG